MLWAISIAIATALTISGIHAKNAELGHGEAGLYRQMPGIFAGVFIGFFLDNPIAVVLVTIAANSAVYYFVLRSALRFWGKAN